MEATFDSESHLRELLEPGEEVRFQARATEAIMSVTDRRVVVAAPHRIALAVPFNGLRRVEFDIERNRPATLVLVPELARDEPQVLAIPQEHYQATAEALVALGLALARMKSGETPE